MSKKILVSVLTSILLASCISIKEVSITPETQQGFVTATLIPTQAQLVPATSTSTPESLPTSTLSAAIPTKCSDAAILLRDVTVPDDTQMNAGEKFTKTMGISKHRDMCMEGLHNKVLKWRPDECASFYTDS